MSPSNTPDILQPARTKLLPPTVRKGALPRETLANQLRTLVREKVVTLISAPAGYGKTTLLSGLAAFADSREMAWLTLDEREDEPIRLLSGLLASIQEVHPTCATQVQALLTNHPGQVRDAADRLVNLLINEIIDATSDPLVLVCDDLHELSNTDAFSVLTQFIEHLPESLHVILSSRTDPPLPLPRWRARNRLGEIRLEDLRFTEHETSVFLRRMLGGNVDQTSAETIHTITEGWPAGIHLFASSLRQAEQPHRHFRVLQSQQQGREHVFDYLAAEVLSDVDSDVRGFLLQCSILRELDPDVCATVTGRDGAGDLLRQLYRRNLFLLSEQQSVQEEGGKNEKPTRASASTQPVFRFHPLFADFLRHRLPEEYPPGQIRELHARAGAAERTVERRIDHLIHGHVWEEALTLMLDAGPELARRGAYARVERWLDAVPSSYEDDGRYQYVRGVCALCYSEYERAEDALRNAVQTLGEEGRTEETGCAEAHLATVALIRDEMQAAQTHIARSIDKPVPVRTKIQLLMGRARAALIRQEWDAAQNDLDRALHKARQAASRSAVHAVLAHLHVVFAALPDGIEYVEKVCRLASDHVGDDPSLTRLALVSQQAYVTMIRGELDQSLDYCREGTALLDTYRFGTLFMAAGLMVARLSAALGQNRIDDVEQQLEENLDLLREMGIPNRVVPGLFYFMGRVAWQRGDLETLREAKAQIEPAVNEDKLPGAPVLHAMVNGLLKIAEQRYEEAKSLLLRASRLKRERRITVVFGRVAPLLGHLYHLRREESALTSLLNEWLAACKHRGTPGSVLREGEVVVPLMRHAAQHSNHPEYGRLILNRMGHTESITRIVVPETGEQLTERESEVLRLIEDGNSNQQIANALHVSMPTVKTHVSNVLAKLDVRSGTQAAVRARELRVQFDWSSTS